MQLKTTSKENIEKAERLADIRETLKDLIKEERILAEYFKRIMEENSALLCDDVIIKRQDRVNMLVNADLTRAVLGDRIDEVLKASPVCQLIVTRLTG